MSLPAQLQILGENWVTGDCTITVSSGDALKAYLYDQKPATQWISSGSSDTTTETITIVFKNRYGTACNQTIDTVILNNTNGKAISVSTSLAGTPTLLGTATGAAADIVITGTAIECDTLIVSISTTQTANQEKTVGELKACLALFTAEATTKFKRKDNWRAGDLRVRSGALTRWREYAKQEGSLTIQNLSLAQRDLLNAAVNDYAFLTFIFYGAYDYAEIFEFAVTEALDEAFDRLSRLFEISLSLKER